MIGRLWVYLWVLPTTCVGLLFLVPTWVSGGGARIVEGVIEIHGGAAAWFLRRVVPLAGGASAMTLGHVVIGRSIEALNRTRRHERVHVRQCERWGPLFIPAYLIASAVVWMRGGAPYRDNPFEREAYENA
jgi:hypothetical protein